MLNKEEKLENFIQGYIDGIIFISDDNEFDVDDLDNNALDAIKDIGQDFFNNNFEDLELFCEQAGEFYSDEIWAYAGHNFALTQNSAGEGFWSREGVSKGLGEKLSEKAKECGELRLYCGEDNRLYI